MYAVVYRSSRYWLSEEKTECSENCSLEEKKDARKKKKKKKNVSENANGEKKDPEKAECPEKKEPEKAECQKKEAVGSNEPLALKKEDEWKQVEKKVPRTEDKGPRKVCSRFMKDGTCKYGQGCWFHHLSLRRCTEAEKELAASNTVKDQTCGRFARDGTCAYGRQCWFSHISLNEGSPKKDLTASMPDVRSICRRLTMTGKCKFGLQCWFSHDTLKEDSPSEKPESRSLLEGFDETPPELDRCNPTIVQRKKKKTCPGFKSTGECIFGSKCWYVHDQAAGKDAAGRMMGEGWKTSEESLISPAEERSSVVDFLRRVKCEEICFLERLGLPLVEGIEILSSVSKEQRMVAYSRFTDGSLEDLELFLTSGVDDSGWIDIYCMHTVV